MKTNRSAWHLVKLREIVWAAGVATVLGLEIYLGVFLAARSGHTTTLQTESPAAPNVSISDLMADAR
jgi:hypothetical protein